MVSFAVIKLVSALSAMLLVPLAVASRRADFVADQTDGSFNGTAELRQSILVGREVEVEPALAEHEGAADATPTGPLRGEEARVVRVSERVGGPSSDMITFFEETDYREAIMAHKEFFKKLVEDPVTEYSRMRDKLEQKGDRASFKTEFEGVVLYLVTYLFQNPHCAKWFQKPENEATRMQLIPAVMGVMMDTRDLYPYRATIQLIHRMLAIIDSFHRTSEMSRYYKIEPGTEIAFRWDEQLTPSKSGNWDPRKKGTELKEGSAQSPSSRKIDLRTSTSDEHQNQLASYYHTFRYEYYQSLLLDLSNNDAVLFPTVAYVGSTDLIKLRASGIQLFGVVAEPAYADQYWNSPLDFWSHDMNHARRTVMETSRYFDVYVKNREYYITRNEWTIIARRDWYEECHEFTQFLKTKFIPSQGNVGRKKELLKRKNELVGDEFKRIEPELEELSEKLAYMAIKRMLIFEIVHEKAWPITPESILRNLVVGLDVFPVESIVTRPGENTVGTQDPLNSDPTTLAHALRKLRAGFYDEPLSPIDAIVPIAYRTAEHIAKAAQALYNDVITYFQVEIKNRNKAFGNVLDLVKPMEVLEQQPPYDLFYAFTVDERGTAEYQNPALMINMPAEDSVDPVVSASGVEALKAFKRPEPEDFVFKARPEVTVPSYKGPCAATLPEKLWP